MKYAPMHTDRRCIALHACPCGYYGDPVKPCTCSPGIVAKYQKRISGPLLDRIDIHIEVPRVEYEKLSEQRLGEPSAVIQKRVEAARQRQRERFNTRVMRSTGETQNEATPVEVIASPIQCNADMRPAEVRQFCIQTISIIIPMEKLLT
jgi:magnesium chelatase family protein